MLHGPVTQIGTFNGRLSPCCSERSLVAAYEKRTRHIHSPDCIVRNRLYPESALPGWRQPAKYGAIDRRLRDIQHWYRNSYRYRRHRSVGRIGFRAAGSVAIDDPHRMGLGSSAGGDRSRFDWAWSRLPAWFVNHTIKPPAVHRHTLRIAFLPRARPIHRKGRDQGLWQRSWIRESTRLSYWKPGRHSDSVCPHGNHQRGDVGFAASFSIWSLLICGRSQRRGGAIFGHKLSVDHQCCLCYFRRAGGIGGDHLCILYKFDIALITRQLL